MFQGENIVPINVTADLRRILRDRYPPPDWFMAYEVQVPREEGGLRFVPREEGGLRFADAVAFDTRKGAGMAVHGFELKVSRSDWLHERNNPAKGVAVRAVCDYWWIVAGASGIVQDDELPHGIGLMEADPQGVLEVVHPANGRFPREPLDRALMAAFLRRLDPMEPSAYYQGKIREAEQKGYAKGRNEAGRMERKKRREGVDAGSLDANGYFCP